MELFKKIAAMAEAYDVALAPYCLLGSIALAACLNVDGVSCNAVIQEQSRGIYYNVGKRVLDLEFGKGNSDEDNGISQGSFFMFREAVCV